MATINPVGVWVSKGVHQTTWEACTASTDTIGAQSAPDLPDKTIFARGTFNSGVVKVLGSNHVSGPFNELVDPQGNAISLSSGSHIETILENPLYIKPSVSGATGATDVDVIMISRGGR